jgi:hypothetical protein
MKHIVLVTLCLVVLVVSIVCKNQAVELCGLQCSKGAASVKQLYKCATNCMKVTRKDSVLAETSNCQNCQRNGGWHFGDVRGSSQWCSCCSNNCGGLQYSCRQQGFGSSVCVYNSPAPPPAPVHTPAPAPSVGGQVVGDVANVDPRVVEKTREVARGLRTTCRVISGKRSWGDLNHQEGRAVDIHCDGYSDISVYNWMKNNRYLYNGWYIIYHTPGQRSCTTNEHVHLALSGPNSPNKRTNVFCYETSCNFEPNGGQCHYQSF